MQAYIRNQNGLLYSGRPFIHVPFGYGSGHIAFAQERFMKFPQTKVIPLLPAIFISQLLYRNTTRHIGKRLSGVGHIHREQSYYIRSPENCI